jgi:hypothetical protein
LCDQQNIKKPNGFPKFQGQTTKSGFRRFVSNFCGCQKQNYFKISKISPIIIFSNGQEFICISWNSLDEGEEKRKERGGEGKEDRDYEEKVDGRGRREVGRRKERREIVTQILLSVSFV